MNRLSGYGSFETQDYGTVELKFCNGTYELFAGLIGVESLDEIDAALRPELVPLLNPDKSPMLDKDKQPVMGPKNPLKFLRTMRLYTLAAIQYAALVQGSKSELNEYQVGEIIDEIGLDQIMALIPKEDSPADAKKKGKSLVKPTQ